MAVAKKNATAGIHLEWNQSSAKDSNDLLNLFHDIFSVGKKALRDINSVLEMSGVEI